VLISPRIAGLREHNGEVVGEAAWPAIIDHATHDRLVGLLDDPSRRRENFGRPRMHPLVGLVYCASCGGRMTTAIAPKQGRGYGCRKDENPTCPARVRIVAEPLEAYVEGHVIDQWRNPKAIKIAHDDRMMRIRKITDQMRHRQEQKNEALRMKLRRQVDAKTFRGVTAEIDAAHEQLAREHKRLASEAMPGLPDPSLAWEDLSAEDSARSRRCWSTRSSSLRILTRSSTVGGTTPSAPSRTKIPRWRPRVSRRCTRRGSRSSPGPKRKSRPDPAMEHHRD
jgi:recombinase-like zinc beta ribbon protein